MLEFDSHADLTVDWLQANHYKAHFFGLGFIQVKLTPDQRLHFYHPDLPAFVEEPHDHRYHFVSKVLRGCLSFEVWDVDEIDGVRHVADLENCKDPNEKPPLGDTPNVMKVSGGWTSVQLSYLGKCEVHAGSSYYQNMNTFHTVKPVFEHGPCITFLTRSAPQKDLARIIRSSEPVCPFSQPISDEKLWEVVAECLK